MATLTEILSHKWPNAMWSMTEEDYSTLVWDPGNTDPKPTLNQIKNFNTEVTAALAAREREEQARDALMNRADRVLRTLELLCDCLIDVRVKARVNVALDAALSNQLDQMRSLLRDIRDGNG